MSNLSSLVLGTMIKLWHDSRGHDYVFVAVDTKTNKALFLKANCINQGGAVRANTTKFHKTLDITDLGYLKNVKRVTRVLGTKPLDADQMQKFISSVDSSKTIVLAKKNKAQYHCLPQQDNRDGVLYTT